MSIIKGILILLICLCLAGCAAGEGGKIPTGRHINRPKIQDLFTWDKSTSRVVTPNQTNCLTRENYPDIFPSK